MLSYKICKRLKDAGFPQYLDTWDKIYPEESEAFFDKKKVNLNATPYLREAGEDEIKIPTLEELIEECGDRFSSLEATRKDEDIIGWCAYDYAGDAFEEKKGDTPEEAMAILWLSINKKKND